MTQEDKQLLLKDLCARVPYRPKVKVLHVWNEEKEIEEDIIDTVYCVFPEGYINTETIDSDIPLNDNIILYLRPMSDLAKLGWLQLTEWEIQHPFTLFDSPLNAIDYFLENHLDYRGLISIGLAIEASEDMYKIK